MLLANPHFPWLGSDESRGSPLRFHQLHYTIPGRLDVGGVALSGMPFVVIGHNTRLAWSHTVDRATHHQPRDKVYAARPKFILRHGPHSCRAAVPWARAARWPSG